MLQASARQTLGNSPHERGWEHDGRFGNLTDSQGRVRHWREPPQLVSATEGAGTQLAYMFAWTVIIGRPQQRRWVGGGVTVTPPGGSPARPPRGGRWGPHAWRVSVVGRAGRLSANHGTALVPGNSRAGGFGQARVALAAIAYCPRLGAQWPRIAWPLCVWSRINPSSGTALGHSVARHGQRASTSDVSGVFLDALTFALLSYSPQLRGGGTSRPPPTPRRGQTGEESSGRAKLR